MTVIIGFSDSHEQPWEMSLELREIIGMARKEQAVLVSDGDFIDMLPHGYDAWPGSPFLERLREALQGGDLWLVGGNHDPASWLKKLFSTWPNVHVERRIVWRWTSGPGQRGIEFRHGHGWSPDWWILRHFAPAFVEFMADHFPKQWYWFSRRMGWLPSRRREEAEVKIFRNRPILRLGPELRAASTEPENERDYRMAILAVWNKAVAHAQSKDCRVIVGHTHSWGSLHAGTEVLMADCGTLKEGKYIWIDRKIELCRL